MREDRGILSLATCVCGGGAGRERGDGPRERWIERGGRSRVRGAAAGPVERALEAGWVGPGGERSGQRPGWAGSLSLMNNKTE